MTSKNPPHYSAGGQQDRGMPGGYGGGYGSTGTAGGPPPPGYSTSGAQQQGANSRRADVYYDYGMQMCYRGQHDWRAEYGLGGILCAIFCFPCGLLGLCIDRELICRRCGARRS